MASGLKLHIPKLAASIGVGRKLYCRNSSFALQMGPVSFLFAWVEALNFSLTPPPPPHGNHLQLWPFYCIHIYFVVISHYVLQ